MGGHKAGEKASSFAVERFVELAKAQTESHPFYLMQQILSQVNWELLKLSGQKEEYEGMGTTFVAATVDEDQLYVMNVGDSRLYLMKERLSQITKDHSLVEALVRSGQLTKEEARSHPQKNMITKALGVEPQVEPDFFQVEIREGEKILLCSDGLSNMVEDRELEQSLSQKTAPESLAKRLIDRANEQGGLDNIAVVIAQKEEKR
jgi:protein phosphatase